MGTLVNPYEFAAPATSGPTPADESDLELWLSGAALTGGEGDPIATWTGSSHGRNGSQSDASRRPTVALNQIGTNPAARFFGTDGSDFQWLDLPNFLTGFTEAEIFIVIKVDNDPGMVPASGLWQFGNSGEDVHFPYADGVIYDGFGTTARKTTVNPTPSLSSAFHTYNVTTKAGGWTSRLDGTQLYTTATNTVGWTTAPKLGRMGGATLWLNGYIGEVFMFSRELTSGGRADMFAYCAGIGA